MNTSHQISAEKYTDEWLTHPGIIESLGTFDLDPCSPVNRPWDTAKKHYTILDNGLIQEWDGRVWCNPPYSIIEAFMKKLADHNNGIALVFARTETQWFHNYVWEKADSIFFFKKRLRFFNSKGVQSKSNSGAASVLIAYGKDNMDAIASSGLHGKHILVNYSPMIVVGISPTWFSVVTIAVKHCGHDELAPVYDMVERMAPDKIEKNQHWKAKVRQQIQIVRSKSINNGQTFRL